LKKDFIVIRQKGFTLLELMTTIGVAAISMAVAVPSLTTFMKNAERSAAINEMVSGIHFARNTAVTRNARVTVCASTDSATCDSSDWEDGWIAFVDNDSDQAVDADETVLRASEAMGGATVDSVEFSSSFMFRPNGRIMSRDIATNSGDFTICDSRGAAEARVLVVDIAGRPHTSHYLSDGSAPTCP
jgi:type IV fimbrial biogenesis protein FimT